MTPRSSKRSNRKGPKPTQAARKIKQKTQPQSSINVDELLTTARAQADAGNLPDAIAKLEKVIELRTPNVNLIEELANLYMLDGRAHDAERAFREAVRLRPDSGFEKYAYLSQILGNTEEALIMARRGIELMRTELMGLGSNDGGRAAELRQYQASAHCAVAEICLGIIEDSNDPEVAKRMDADVEDAVMEAMSLSDKGSATEIEAILSLANLRLSQGRRKEARTSMMRILDQMTEGIGMLENGDGSDAAVIAGLQALPPMEIRIAIGKQLLEVEMWNGAVSVLGSVMWECDFNVEVWYLLAVAYWKLNEVAEARNALESTRAVLKSPNGYDGQLDKEMIDKLYSKLEEVSNDTQRMHD